jgi:ubiquinone/menaquinone biosynthesis C-methylase UbiE
MGGFDGTHIAGFFDAYGDREWERHDQTAAARVSLAVHLEFLEQFVRPGQLVLDAGAGPGRFTIAAAELGARVHVGDISAGQLELNRQRVTDASLEHAVTAREVLDICDLSHLGSASFDAAICFGGPLSYVRDQAPQALTELVRVTKSGGYVLLSVMSTLGAMRAFLPAVFAEQKLYGPQHTERIFTTGELDRDTNRGHEMRMYRWSEIAELCEQYGTIAAAAASNYLTAGADTSLLDSLSSDEWDRLRSWELRLSREPGVLDAGTHILIALRAPGA